MLFRKKITRSCAYCSYGTKLNSTDILCVKRGIRNMEQSCRKFLYDPCKRVPPKMKASDFSKYDEEDFSL